MASKASPSPHLPGARLSQIVGAAQGGREQLHRALRLPRRQRGLAQLEVRAHVGAQRLALAALPWLPAPRGQQLQRRLGAAQLIVERAGLDGQRVAGAHQVGAALQGGQALRRRRPQPLGQLIPLVQQPAVVGGQRQRSVVRRSRARGVLARAAGWVAGAERKSAQQRRARKPSSSNCASPLQQCSSLQRQQRAAAARGSPCVPWPR